MGKATVLYVTFGHPTNVSASYRQLIGGAEIQAQRVAELLSRQFDMRMLTQRVPGGAREDVVGGVHIYHVPLNAGGRRGAIDILWRLIVAGMRLSRPDIVQGFQLNALTLAAAWIATMRHVPYIIKITGRGNFERLIGVRGRLQLRLLKRAARVMVVPSQSCARVAMAAGVPAEKIRHIPNGVDTEDFRPPTPKEREALRAELGYGPQDYVFCWIGRLDRLKGLDCVQPAWALLREHCPEARLLVVGDGAEKAVAQDLAAAFPDSVRHLPFQEDVRPFYGCADAVLLTSRSEGLSNVLLEALASGLMAVVSSVPENTEVGAGQDFLLSFDRESPRSLAEALAAAVGMRCRQAELGRLARQHVERNYSLRGTAAKWAELYRGLL